MIVRSVARESRIASAAARRSPRDERQVGGLDRDVGAGADREPEVGLRERGRVVDAVADHRDDAALAPAGARTTVGLVGGQHLGDDLVDADLVRRRRARCAALSPVSRTGRSPSALSAATASADVGLTVSATTSTPRTAPSQADERPRCGPAPRRRVAPASQVRQGSPGPVGHERRRGRPATPWPSTTPSTPRPSRFAKPSTAGSAPSSSRAAPAMACAIGCSDASSTAPARRSTSRALVAVGDATSTRLMRPVVTVPVLSSTIVSTRRVDSRISGPLISSPSCAPRPVPTSSAVGVASPSAHGQAMISTATAAVNANAASSPAPSQKPSVGDREADHDRDEHARDAVGEPLDRRLAGLRVGDEPRRSGPARCRRRPWSRARQAAAGVDGRAGDLVAGPLLDRDRLAGEQRLVDGAGRPPRRRRRSRPSRRGGRRSGRRRRAARPGRGARRRRRRARRRPWRPARAARAARRRRGAWRAPRSSGRRAGTRSRRRRPRGRSRRRRRRCSGSGRSSSSCRASPASPRNSA